MISIQNNCIVVQTSYENRFLCKQVPGYKWHKVGKFWSWPASPTAAKAIIDTDWGDMEIDGEVYDTANMVYWIKTVKEQPEHLSEIPHTKLVPWRHQLQGYHMIGALPGVMLAFDMGTGKTKTAIDYIQNQDNLERVLIVCPKSVVAVWPAEVEKRAALAGPIHALGSGPLAKRARQMCLSLEVSHITYAPKPVIFIVNYEAVWQNAMGKVVNDINWDLIIADEIHRIKAPNGKASKFLAKLNAKKKIGLTGTPMPHSPLDVYAQYRFLDPTIFGNNFTAFRSRYALMGGYQGKEVKGFQNEQELNEKFYSIALRVMKEDVLDLPDAVDVIIPVTLGALAQKVYNDLETDFVAEVDEGTVTASNALAKLIRLQQVTSGFAKTTDDKEVDCDTAKADALAEFLDGLPIDEPVVVFCRFHHDLNTIPLAAKKTGRGCYELSGRTNELSLWQRDDNGSVLAVQIHAGGVGIDLTRANYAVYYSHPWSLGDFLQSKARLHRHGQVFSVTFVHLLAQGSIDERMYSALAAKKDVIDSVLEGYTHKENDNG